MMRSDSAGGFGIRAAGRGSAVTRVTAEGSGHAGAHVLHLGRHSGVSRLLFVNYPRLLLGGGGSGCRGPHRDGGSQTSPSRG